jgi:uroporphyrinogen decarboxylase
MNIIMQFASKQIGAKYGDYCMDYRVLVEGNLYCCERFGIDAVSVISDPCREAGAFGQSIDYPPDGVPNIRGVIVNEHNDLKNLRCSHSEDFPRLKDRILAVESFKKQIKGEYPIIGWVEGPFAEAADLRGVQNILMDTILEPDFVKGIMDITLEQATLFAKEQVDAGADIIGVGDAAASLVGPQIYEEIVLPYESELLKRIKEMNTKTKLHICGNIEPYLEILPVEYCDIIDLDWMVSIKKAIALHGNKVSFSGNVNPVLILQLEQSELEKIITETITAASANPCYIFAGGCEIPRDTPEDNMVLIAKILKEA